MKKLVIFVSVGIVGLFLLPTSCDHYTIDELEVQSYLFLEGGDGLSLQDQKMLREAFIRAGIGFQEGKFRYKARSGKELNMSEQLFEMLKGIVDNSNNRRLSLNIKPTVPRLKSGVENPNASSDTTSSDCVAHAISSVLDNFNVALPHNDIDSWIVSQYGADGVPASSFYDVLDEYLVGEPISIPSPYLYTGTGSQIIVVIKTGANEGHAVTLQAVDNDTGNILVYDPQAAYEDPESNDHGYVFSVHDVLLIYEATGAR